MTTGAYLGGRTTKRVIGGGGGPPNADISRDIRVLMGLDPDAFTDGTYYMYPGSIATGDAYYGGHVDTSAHPELLHAFDNTKPRNGWLRLAPWTPGTVEYDGSLTAGGSSLSDVNNGGGLGEDSYSSDSMNGDFRTILEGIKWTNAATVWAGSGRVMFRLNDMTFPMTAVKAQYDQVCTQLGVTVVSVPPNTTPYNNAFDHPLWKRNANCTGFRHQGSPSGGATGRMRSLCNTYHDMPNDGIFWGGGSGAVSYGDIMYNLFRPTAYGSSTLFGTRYHSDVIQMIGGEGMSSGRGGQCDVRYLTAAACTDVEHSAEVGDINVKFGRAASPGDVWLMGQKAAAYIIDATHGYPINSGEVGIQWYAAGQDPFGGGYNASFDDVSIQGSPGLTRVFSHVLPGGVGMTGNVMTNPVNDIIVANIGPAAGFRAAHATISALDSFCSSMGWFD